MVWGRRNACCQVLCVRSRVGILYQQGREGRRGGGCIAARGEYLVCCQLQCRNSSCMPADCGQLLVVAAATCAASWAHPSFTVWCLVAPSVYSLATHSHQVASGVGCAWARAVCVCVSLSMCAPYTVGRLQLPHASLWGASAATVAARFAAAVAKRFEWPVVYLRLLHSIRQQKQHNHISGTLTT